MPEKKVETIRALYEAFSRRDVEGLVRLADRGCELFPVGTARLTGRQAPYVGHEGLRDYFKDVDDLWEELRLVPQAYRACGALVLVTGRVYARDRAGTLTDSEAGWVWTFNGDLIASGHVFDSTSEALDAFALAAGVDAASEPARPLSVETS